MYLKKFKLILHIKNNQKKYVPQSRLTHLKTNMSEKCFLKWNDFHSNISQSFSTLRKEDNLSDVTLTGDDHKHVRAHKLVLSAASEYFSNIFRQNSDNSNIIICFDGVNVVDIQNALNFMYNGEIQIYQDDLILTDFFH